MRDYLLVIFGFATFGLGFLVIQLFKWLSQFKLVKKDDSIKKRAYAKRVVEPPETPNCRCAMPEEYEPKKTTNSVLAKLNESQVADIYTSKDIPRVLAEKYGVSRQAIQDIKGGISWRYVTKDLQKPEKKRKNKESAKLLKKHSPYRGSHETIDEYEKQLRQAYLKYIVAEKGQIEKICLQHRIDSNALYCMKSPLETLLKYSKTYDLPQMREEFDKMIRANYSLDEIVSKLYEDFAEKRSGEYACIVVIVKSFFRLQYLGEK